jgi:hypothetical protein
MKIQEYDFIIIESFIPVDNTARHGIVHLRPIPGQGLFQPSMFVECSKHLSSDYPVGTKFRIKAKITQREGGTPFIYSHYLWTYEVLKS